MEEKTRLRLTVAATIVIGIAYFFLFAMPFPKSLTLKPKWVSSIPPALTASVGSSIPSQRLLSFELGDRYGYFDRDTGVHMSATRGYGASVSDAGYVAWDMKPASLQFRDPLGKILITSLDSGYPFMDGDRRFVIAPNQESLRELDIDGSILWKRDFPSLVTAFASNRDIAVIGTLDGQLFAIGRGGKELLSFAPGGSKISCIYGCAISPDGKEIAITSGIEKQRVLVLEKRAEAYRVTWHRWVDSDFRRPVAMTFTEDGRELVFETSGGLGVYDVASRKEHLLPARDPVVSGVSLSGRNMLLALDRSGPAILAASYDGRGYFTFPFAADRAMLRGDGNSLFLGLTKGDASSLLRLDFVEE